MKLEQVVKDSFSAYASAVAQSRAIVDVRDCMKPALRLISYFNYDDKYYAPRPTAKSLKLISSAMRGYVHGDASCYSTLIRAAKPFAMRYPLYDCQGSYGNLTENNTEASARYTETRLSELGKQLFNLIDEDTITEWEMNYDDTEKFPRVLPSVGYWNICNGTMGIGVGISSSIPQFNLREVNRALIQRIRGEEVDIPLPDFATGGVLLNAKESLEALKAGSGASCKLRAKMAYDNKTRTFTVTELPYATYTNTICRELEELMESEEVIETFHDVAGITPRLTITIKKGVNPSQAQSLLFSKTSLQNHYMINLTMLSEGKVPKVFTFLEALDDRIAHERVIYRRSFEYRVKKINERLHILEGYIIACARIEEVIEVIKSSRDRSDAEKNLQSSFDLTQIQADAILKLTLSRIASLEVQKFIQEKEGLEKERERILTILGDEKLFVGVLIDGWESVSERFGDKRRTELQDVEEEVANRLYYITSDGRVGLNPPKSGEVVGTIPIGSPILLVTEAGRAYYSTEQPKRLKKVFGLKEGEKVVYIGSATTEQYLTLSNSRGGFRSTPVNTLVAEGVDLHVKAPMKIELSSEPLRRNS